ncbi:hypothetical protein Goari_026897, partial [Gossypium aridum]|nr:hypothetical protein [Gossypium aridum]
QSVDQVLQCFIRNIHGPPSPLIENYLREASFCHVANIGKGCKLDPKLISAFVERWRPEMHTFHLLCRECTIILEDMQLQLGLPVDESVLTEPAQSANWRVICYDLLGAISDIIYKGWINMGWLHDTFRKPGDDSTKVERVRYARAYILQILEVAPEVLDDEHKIDLWRLNTHWSVFHSEYIKMWENRYDNIPTREPIIVSELACNPDYMPWFVIYGKPYLLSEEQRHRQFHVERERWGPLILRTRASKVGPSIVPMQSPAPSEQSTMPTPQPL